MEERLKVKKVLLQVDVKVEDVEDSPKISKTEAPKICLPNISVQSFDRNILNWTYFGE